MVPTLAQLKSISKSKWTSKNEANAQSVIVSLVEYGAKPAIGLDFPHRLAHYLCQIFHESGAFFYDQEIASGKAYNGRKDLGNTQPGDGERFKGRTAMQLTGRANYAAFTAWCRKIDPKCPDFEKNPELVNTDPYEGLVPIWFWTVGNSTGKSLNRYADKNDIENITRKINGGVNGLEDRLEYYTRTGLVLLGHAPTAIMNFQKKAHDEGWYPENPDGDDGPLTRGAVHKALANLSAAKIVATPSVSVQSSPVVQTKEVAVAPKGVENAAPDVAKVGGAVLTGAAAKYAEPVINGFGSYGPWIQGSLLLIAVGLFVWFVFGRQLLASRATQVKKDVKEQRDAGLPT